MKKLPTIPLTLVIFALCSIGFADEQRGDAEAHPYFTDRLQISAGGSFLVLIRRLAQTEIMEELGR